MENLEIKKLEPEATPEQALTKKERAVFKKAQGIFSKNAVLRRELLNPKDLNLSPERSEELGNNLGKLLAETEKVLNTLPKTNKPDYFSFKDSARS